MGQQLCSSSAVFGNHLPMLFVHCLTLHKGNKEYKPGVSEQTEESFFSLGRGKNLGSLVITNQLELNQKYIFLLSILFDIRKEEPGHNILLCDNTILYVATAGETGREKRKYSGVDRHLYSRSVTDRPLVLPPQLETNPYHL